MIFVYLIYYLGRYYSISILGLGMKVLAWCIVPNGIETKMGPNTHTLLVSKNVNSHYG